MATYTEVIFGAMLCKNTPRIIIESLRYLMGEREKPKEYPLSNNLDRLLCGSSSYFAINRPVNKMWKCSVYDQWHISSRFNIKNRDNEIEEFLRWIRPYIEEGSGKKEIYAIVINELDESPEIYSLRV